MRIGDDDEPAPAAPAPATEGEEVEVSDGEAVYTVLSAALDEADEGQQTRIALALAGKTPWEALEQDIKDFFHDVGTMLFDDESNE